MGYLDIKFLHISKWKDISSIETRCWYERHWEMNFQICYLEKRRMLNPVGKTMLEAWSKVEIEKNHKDIKLDEKKNKVEEKSEENKIEEKSEARPDYFKAAVDKIVECLKKASGHVARRIVEQTGVVEEVVGEFLGQNAEELIENIVKRFLDKTDHQNPSSSVRLVGQDGKGIVMRFAGSFIRFRTKKISQNK